MIEIDHLDHLVLTVADLDRTVEFYTRVLGMRDVKSDRGRRAVHFGGQKINLHRAGHEFEPKAERATPGSGDLCFIAETPLDDAIAHIEGCGVTIELGPVERAGATGQMMSVYFRDPDGNLIEVSNYLG